MWPDSQNLILSKSLHEAMEFHLNISVSDGTTPIFVQVRSSSLIYSSFELSLLSLSPHNTQQRRKQIYEINAILIPTIECNEVKVKERRKSFHLLIPSCLALIFSAFSSMVKVVKLNHVKNYCWLCIFCNIMSSQVNFGYHCIIIVGRNLFDVG